MQLMLHYNSSTHNCQNMQKQPLTK